MHADAPSSVVRRREWTCGLRLSLWAGHSDRVRKVRSGSDFKSLCHRCLFLCLYEPAPGWRQAVVAAERADDLRRSSQPPDGRVLLVALRLPNTDRLSASVSACSCALFPVAARVALVCDWCDELFCLSQRERRARLLSDPSRADAEQRAESNGRGAGSLSQRVARLDHCAHVHQTSVACVCV